MSLDDEAALRRWGWTMALAAAFLPASMDDQKNRPLNAWNLKQTTSAAHVEDHQLGGGHGL